MNMTRQMIMYVLAAAVAWTSVVRAEPVPEQRACRSIHLFYKAPTGTAFFNEMKIMQSAPGSYFMAAGWSTGYMGFQELANGKKIAIFSVWDKHEGNDPGSVPDEVRVQVLAQGENVRVSRFGGEGTGGKSMFDYDWNIGETYHFLVTAAADSDRTVYSGYFFMPETKTWKHMATFSTITGGRLMNGYYSFVEDFRRNFESAKLAREARFTRTWVRDAKNEWHPCAEAQFTGDSNPALNIDAGLTEGWYRLITGGATQNLHTKLWGRISKPANTFGAPPADLPGLE
ncbi:MAG: DUF3472 domain-containing protein [Planctomycetes bacterium]|nr:DUF3472 domain-containing protein [Planctomycetota bacterium]